MSTVMKKFREGCGRLSQTLGLDGSMVAVTFTDEVPPHLQSADPVVACQAIQDARYGKTVILNKENSKCLGASYFLGFDPFSPLAYDYWVENEQSLYNKYAATTMVHMLPRPCLNRARFIILSPAAEVSENPDLVLAVCNAEQTSRLLGLHIFKTGVPAKTYSYGATCQSAIGIPIATMELNVSFIDLPSRQIAEFEPSEQIVTIPFSQMQNVFDSIGGCINGTADPKFNRKGLVFLRGGWKKPSGN